MPILYVYQRANTRCIARHAVATRVFVFFLFEIFSPD
jgi:hypothetical protein